MGTFTRITADAFDGFTMDAGILLNKFSPESPKVEDQDIICATTGGVTASCVPEYQDMGEDVDNCPKNLKDLKKLKSWECKLGFTALSSSPEMLQMALGAADVAPETGKVTPRRDLDHSKDFKDIWWVGDRLDGGMVAICLKNALSTGGLSLRTMKNGKGQFAVELTGHPTAETQTVAPMEFYSKAAPLAAAAAAPAKGKEANA